MICIEARINASLDRLFIVSYYTKVDTSYIIVCRKKQQTQFNEQTCTVFIKYITFYGIRNFYHYNIRTEHVTMVIISYE